MRCKMLLENEQLLSYFPLRDRRTGAEMCHGWCVRWQLCPLRALSAPSLASQSDSDKGFFLPLSAMRIIQFVISQQQYCISTWSFSAERLAVNGTIHKSTRTTVFPYIISFIKDSVKLLLKACFLLSGNVSFFHVGFWQKTAGALIHSSQDTPNCVWGTLLLSVPPSLLVEHTALSNHLSEARSHKGATKLHPYISFKSRASH